MKCMQSNLLGVGAVLWISSLYLQFLPVPELMPFRLTPQYLGVVEPLGKEGPLACAMQHALRALRADVAPLLDVLDVFVQEPTIDWMVG